VAGENFFEEAPKPRRRRKQPWPEEPPPRGRAIAKPVHIINGRDVESADVVLPPGFTDDDVGLRFSEMFAPSLRFVAGWNRWMLWDGAIWRKDDTLRTYDLVRRTCRVMGGEALDPKVRAAMSSARMVAGVEKLVRSDRRHASTPEQWDADPWLLNTPGGVVDLLTGEMTEAKPNYLMTKTTAVAPAGDCPQWLAFLDKVTGNNLQLRDYLKRVAGYWLTGLTREHAMWFFYGTGRNGKGVFLNTLVRIMGDYAMTASPDTFTEAGSGKHLTVLARLQGARLVVSQETEEGIPWAETRIKSVTGGDPITANHMRQDPFTYLPQFKLGISGNHKPELKSVDEAIRARFNLVPFTITIPPNERDPALSEKLWDEAPGILAWALEGCLDWQAVRLRPPDAVTLATGEYFESEDAVATWISECCVIDLNISSLSSSLFASWSSWSARQGERHGSHKSFSKSLERHGYQKERRRDGIYVLGIKAVLDMSYQT
jgi:putative DNA primase/helicase